MSSIKTTSFGGDGGSPFPMAIVDEIGLRSGSGVDQILINGNTYGGTGGTDRGAITLAGDYISKVDIRSGSLVDNVNFTTNEGSAIGGGGGGGNPVTLDSIRVLAIGGRSGSMVDNLRIMYIDGYRPSTVVAKNVGFILSYSPPFEKFEEYTDSVYKNADSYQLVTEHMLSQDYKASVEGEYYVKVAASTEIAIEDSSLQTVSNELQTELNSGVKKTQEIPSGYVGVKLVSATLMKDADGTAFWMFPTSQPSYSVISVNDTGNVLDHYDLTGELYTQMPGLQAKKQTLNGYVYYARS